MKHPDTQAVQHLAKLARLKVNGDEIAALQQQLDQILTLIDTMQAVDTDSIEPMYHAHDGVQPLRQDVVTEHDQRTAMMQNAPLSDEGVFLVPKVVETK